MITDKKNTEGQFNVVFASPAIFDTYTQSVTGFDVRPYLYRNRINHIK